MLKYTIKTKLGEIRYKIKDLVNFELYLFGILSGIGYLVLIAKLRRVLLSC